MNSEVMKLENVHVSKIHSVLYVGPTPPDTKRIVYGKRLQCNELVFKLSGDSVTHFNGKALRGSVNSIRFLPKIDKVDYYVDFNEPGECIDVFFDTVEPLGYEAYAIDVSKNLKLKDLFLKIHKLWSKKQSGYYNKCLALLYEIFSEIELAKYSPSEKMKKLQSGIDYLTENALSHAIDYGKPSRLCGVCETYFRREFKAMLGISPLQYVRKTRIDNAKQLILTGRYSVAEIANMCGYSDTYQFSKQFKNQTGLSPTIYAQGL